ncbi:MAG: MBL fold metallo-hydrolase [Acidobacteria bacterium]|nr:MBL fold metallo-hydrolase [Acidobacteriota bacterium]
MSHRLLFVAASLLIAAHASAQRGPARDPLVREGVTVKLGEHSYAIPDGGVGGVPNVGIVVGTRGTLVIDPGMGRRNGEAVLREVAKISKNAELYVASTHFHPEHTMGYLAFPPAARYVNSTVQEAEFAELGMGMVKGFADRSALQGELLKDAQRRVADITFDRDYALDLGGVRVRFLVVGPTHTRGDTTFFVEGDNVLYAGDVVMNMSFVAANQNSSVKAWLSAFDRLEARGPKTIVPAHGPIGDGALIPGLRTIMQGVATRARELRAQGRPVDEAAMQLQREFQAKYPGWARANGVAAIARVAYIEAP